jgi:hypothetical protein
MSLTTANGERTAIEAYIYRKRTFMKMRYAIVSFVESIPCIKATFSGVPHCSEHYKLVHLKLLQFIQIEIGKYARLHLLTDSTKAGIVLEEDLAYYKMHILPAIGAAGIRYHAIVLPESAFGKFFIRQASLSTKKLKVECFNTVASASKWLKQR